MIEMLVAYIFEAIGHVWRTTAGYITPDEDDVRAVLDEAAKMLYDRPIGTRLETGGLIVEKRDTGFDVYAYLGNYV